jgi:hypothetical protein
VGGRWGEGGGRWGEGGGEAVAAKPQPETEEPTNVLTSAPVLLEGAVPTRLHHELAVCAGPAAHMPPTTHMEKGVRLSLFNSQSAAALHEPLNPSPQKP